VAPTPLETPVTSTERKWRPAALLLVILLIAGSVACHGKATSAIDDLGLGALLQGNARVPQVVADEEITVAAHGWRGPGFTLPSPRTVQIVADGKKHTDKGFRVYVMAPDELTNFEKRKPFKDIPAFEGLKVHALDKTDTLPAGSWCVVVHNSENILQAMVVHLRVVVGPT
jgi:hypothetical protein